MWSTFIIIGFFIFISLGGWMVWRAFSPISIFVKKCSCGSYVFLKVLDNEYTEQGDQKKNFTEKHLECFECGKERIILKEKKFILIEVEV